MFASTIPHWTNHSIAALHSRSNVTGSEIVVRKNDYRVDALGQAHSLQIARETGRRAHILWTVPELMPGSTNSMPSPIAMVTLGRPKRIMPPFT